MSTDPREREKRTGLSPATLSACSAAPMSGPLASHRPSTSLLEVLLVLGVAGALVAAVASTDVSRVAKGASLATTVRRLFDVGMGCGTTKVDRARTDIRSLQLALEAHAARYGRHPDSLEALVATGLIERMPLDPWDTAYLYKKGRHTPVIFSYGADKTPGGTGSDADLSSLDSVGSGN